MTVMSWEDLIRRAPPLDRPVRLTIGVFDGLHLGHRRLMEEIAAGPAEGVPLVITFRGGPAVRYKPRPFPGFILSYPQKLDRLAMLGVGAVVAIDFSEELSNLSGEDFVGLLRENLTIQKIVVGQNFRFGKNRNSGTDDLKGMLSDSRIEVTVTEPVYWGGGMVSSSRIRQSLERAEFADARSMLAIAYALDVSGVARELVDDRTARFARADITQVVPPVGSYKVRGEGPAGAREALLTVQSDWLTMTADGCSGITAMYFSQ